MQSTNLAISREGKLTVTNEHLMNLVNALIEAGYDISVVDINIHFTVDGNRYSLYHIDYKAGTGADFTEKAIDIK